MAVCYVEVWRAEGRDLVALEAERVTVGKAASNDIAIRSDPKVSRLHAVLERFAAGWCIRDLGSHNGTFVNGRRILAEHRLEGGDEIGVGQTRLVFRMEEPGRHDTKTQAAEGAPGLTLREREVLLALCRPLFAGDLFTEPASIREMANELVVTEAAIKQHLLHLYDKFGIHDETSRRRVRLANEAIRRGAVSLAELRAKRTASSKTER
jgi:pSer/pThr/pTyr-binding forkhead associated (FHA) protein